MIIRLLTLFPLLVFMGCTASRQIPQKQQRPPALHQEISPSLAAPSSEIRSIQLYRTGQETNLPIITLQSNESLTLEFDLMSAVGRPLSVYFYHTDRFWNPDLAPTEFTQGFNRDDLIFFDAALQVALPYTHYTYRFPNERIQFLTSGNYILRVTEQGREDAVLFERVFFISENNAQMQLSLHPLLLGNTQGFSIQPSVAIIPPTAIQQNIFDFYVCFAQDGQLTRMRCPKTQPTITPPTLQFSLLPSSAFAPSPGLRLLDLSTLRPGKQILSIDFKQLPYQVILSPDPAGGGANLDGIRLNGQPVISAAVTEVTDPDITAEYVQTTFRFIPPEEKPLADPVLLLSSLNGWSFSNETRLLWNPEKGFYEGTLLIKQGLYEYRYFAPNLSRRLRSFPSGPHLYSAFLYYYDPSRNTDRLLSVEHAIY